MLHPVPPRFGDDTSRELYARRLRAACATQAVRYAVAPGMAFKVRRGGVEITLTEGQEVTLEDLQEARPGVAPHVLMQHLIDCWWVLDREEMVR